MCFVLAMAAGQLKGMFLGLFFLGWGAVAWYLRYGKNITGNTSSRQGTLSLGSPSGTNGFITSRTQSNIALQMLREDKTYEHTPRMVKAVPDLARQLLTRALEEAANLNGAANWYSDCVLDLELTGAFHRVLEFCNDAALAALFVDALLFEATGNQPTVPEDLDVMSSLTHLYRGIGKYVIAKSTLALPPAELPLWVFGSEHAAAVNCPLNIDRVLEGRRAALQIREFAFSKTSSALVGKIVVSQAAYVKPTSFPGCEYVIRPGMQRPSKFKDQPDEYKNLVLASLKRVAQGTPAPKDSYR